MLLCLEHLFLIKQNYVPDTMLNAKDVLLRIWSLSSLEVAYNAVRTDNFYYWVVAIVTWVHKKNLGEHS